MSYRLAYKPVVSAPQAAAVHPFIVLSEAFLVPAFQRRYRLTQDAVRKLLIELQEDVGKVKHSSLQPIVGSKHETKDWKRDERQRRLTRLRSPPHTRGTILALMTPSGRHAQTCSRSTRAWMRSMAQRPRTLERPDAVSASIYRREPTS